MLFTGDDENSEKQTLNLSKQQLKKVPKQDDAQNIRKLILDENELQKIDNIDSYLKIETVSRQWHCFPLLLFTPLCVHFAPSSCR